MGAYFVFFTAGEPEVRRGRFQRITNAVTASARLSHIDLEKGFIQRGSGDRCERLIGGDGVRWWRARVKSAVKLDGNAYISSKGDVMLSRPLGDEYGKKED